MQDIDIYYESLGQVYKQMTRWEQPKPLLRQRLLGWVVGVGVVFLLLSIVPLLPVILVFLGSRFNWTLGRLTLRGATLGNFLLVWLFAVTITALFVTLVSWISNRRESPAPTGPPQTLSPDQLTFIASYEAYKELKIFFVSHIDQHVDNSLKALSRILQGRMRRELVDLRGDLSPRQGERMLITTEGGVVEHSYPTYLRDRFAPSLPKEISIARSFLRTFEPFAWFQLDARTKSILQALLSLQEKLPYRLKQREDLPAVLSVLENLSKFLYAYLPEHKTYMDAESLKRLHSEGDDCLRRFVDEVVALTAFSPPEQKKSRDDTPSATFREKYHHYYAHYVFLRFTLWFVLILLLTSGAVFLLNQIVKLSADTMATVVIGTSVASAAVLAGFLPKTSKTNKSDLS